jgi:hypothetical protein
VSRDRVHAALMWVAVIVGAAGLLALVPGLWGVYSPDTAFNLCVTLLIVSFCVVLIGFAVA